MPIFIAKRGDGKIESIILSENLSLANAYWQGLGINVHSITEFTEDDLKDHPTGVIPILNPKEKKIYHNGILKSYLYKEKG